MELGEAVRFYRKATGGYGRSMDLAAFGLSRSGTENIFSVWDEDYQISRFMELTLEASNPTLQGPSSRPYTVNGFEYSHVRFHADIERMLPSTPPS